MKGRTSENNAFWNGLSEQKFLLQFDQRSARYQFYPRPLSLFSIDPYLEWQAAAGTGVIVAFTQDRTRAAKGELSVLLVLVQLDEGPRVFAPIIDCQFGDLKIGAAVEFSWSDTQVYPYRFKLRSVDHKALHDTAISAE